MAGRFEVYEDASGGARWRLKSSNGQTVASAGEAFASASNAKRAAERFKKNAQGSTTSEIYADSGGKYRWRAKARNGQTVASSGESLGSQANARRAADRVQKSASAASGR